VKPEAVVPVPSGQAWDGFYSALFIVPKKGSGLRPILNVKVFNQWRNNTQ